MYGVLTTRASAVQSMLDRSKCWNEWAHLLTRSKCLLIWLVFTTYFTSPNYGSVYDPSHVINYEPLDIQHNLTYEELLVQVLDLNEQQLRTKTITHVKVLSQNHGVEEASWELKQRERYPHLFEWIPVWTLDSYHFSIILWIKMLDYKCVKRFSVQNFED